MSDADALRGLPKTFAAFAEQAGVIVRHATAPRSGTNGHRQSLFRDMEK
ncbi:hypothetical protein [Acetobacter persici]|nr:hypothetical protein [Acetobacter persici]